MSQEGHEGPGGGSEAFLHIVPVIVHKSDQEWVEGVEIPGQRGELI